MYEGTNKLHNKKHLNILNILTTGNKNQFLKLNAGKVDEK